MLFIKKLLTKYLLLNTLILLTSCGFSPMYGEKSAFNGNNPLAGNLVIDDIGDRDGQIFKTALEDNLNPEGKKISNPKYRLQVKLVKTLTPSVIKGDGTVQRYSLQYISNYILFDNLTNQKISSGYLNRIGSYNAAANANFATYEADKDISERTIKELSEDYALRLAGYFSTNK